MPPEKTDQIADTLGHVPPSVAALARFAPGAFDGYLAHREWVYRTPPGGALDLKTIEILFTVLDVVAGHEAAALAHTDAAVKAGATTAELAQALAIAVLIHGHKIWGTCGYKVVEHAAALEARAAPRAV